MSGSEPICVYSAIKSLITSGEISSGEPLSQLDLTRRLGVSRTPVREALRRLQAEGLVEAQRNKRMRVTVITPEELDTVYATRVLMESMGVALSVTLMTPRDLEDVKQCSAAINWEYGDGDTEERDEQLLKFKLLIMKYAGTGVQDEVQRLFERCERVRKIYQVVSPGSLIVAREEHEALLSAFLNVDVERAVFVASRHLARTALAVIGYIAPDFEPRALRYALAQTAEPVNDQDSVACVNVIGSGPLRPPAAGKRVHSKPQKIGSAQGDLS